jgi:hypothetical protein
LVFDRVECVLRERENEAYMNPFHLPQEVELEFLSMSLIHMPTTKEKGKLHFFDSFFGFDHFKINIIL